MKKAIFLFLIILGGFLLPNTSYSKILNDLKAEFFEKQIEFDPSTGYYFGIEKYADQVRPYDKKLRDEMRTFFTRFLAEMESYPLDLLATQDRIDAVIMRSSALWNLLRLEDKQPLGWRSSADISYLVNVVYYNVSRQKGELSAWEAIVKKMRIIPDILRVHRENLEEGIRDKAPFYKREVEREAIDLEKVVSKYFQEDVINAAKKSLSKKDLSKIEPKLKSAANGIDSALDSYISFVKSKILPLSKPDGFAIGEEEYAWRLRQLLLSTETPESLYAYGKSVVQQTEKDMTALADEIQQKKGEASKPLKQVLEDITKNAPKTDVEMFEMYRDLIGRAAAFIRKKHLFKLPDNYEIQLTETPEAYRNVLGVAAMNSVPPFSDSIPGQFWVTPTKSKKFPDGNPQILMENHSLAAAPNLVVHEAVPGHDLQLGFSARRFVAGGRVDKSFKVRLFVPDVMFSLGVEGWAHYAEQVMAEQGFYTPEERLLQLKDAQWRNVRIVVDIGIHTGRMKYDEAVKYFAEKTMSGDYTAEHEIYRYSKWPLQAITYHLGKRDLLNLRDEVQKITGVRAFDLARFHELVLLYDGVPVSLYREDLLSNYEARIVTPDEPRKKRRKK